MSKPISDLTPELQSRFLDLACDLSPENLSCDGEASPAFVRNRLARIRAEWRDLERQVGRSVTEDEVWAAEYQG